MSESSMTILGAAALAVGLLALPAQAHGHHSMSIDDDDLSRGCDSIHIRFDEAHTARATETFALSRSEASRLVADGGEFGGIHVSGWDRDGWEITACKAGSGETRADAEKIVGAVTVSHAKKRVEAGGPRGGDWFVYFIVKAPRNADLSIEAEHGPLALEGVSGHIEARSENGPLALRDVSGTVMGRTTNGPLSIVGGSGEIDASTENGPLSVKLTGGRWDGRGLEARTQNGPLSVKLSEDYGSAVHIQASSHSPVACRSAACRGSFSETDDGTKSFDFGSGPTVVRLSTVNGPLSVSRR